jgi:hypothetical protein
MKEKKMKKIKVRIIELSKICVKPINEPLFLLFFWLPSLDIGGKV